MRSCKPFSFIVVLAALALSSTNTMAACPSLPYSLTNGQTADATQVMGNFNQLATCLNSGQLVVPPVSSLAVTSPGGGVATIQNPSATTNYNLNLPTGPGTAGQVLTSAGGGSSAMTWTTVPTVTAPPLVDGRPVGRPAASSLIWLNQGGASYTEYANGPITISLPSQNGDRIRGLGQTPLGSTPYTLTAKLGTMLWGKNYFMTGLYLIDSAGKLITLDYSTSASSGQTPHNLAVTKWNSTMSYNSTAKVVAVSESPTWWFRIHNNGTNWIFYVSPNGADWLQVYSEGLSAFLGSTISSIGVYGNNNDTTAIGLNTFISIWSFELASGSGTNSSW